MKGKKPTLVRPAEARPEMLQVEPTPPPMLEAESPLLLESKGACSLAGLAVGSAPCDRTGPCDSSRNKNADKCPRKIALRALHILHAFAVRMLADEELLPSRCIL